MESKQFKSECGALNLKPLKSILVKISDAMGGYIKSTSMMSSVDESLDGCLHFAELILQRICSRNKGAEVGEQFGMFQTFHEGMHHEKSNPNV
jgi:hypothetical protein